MTAALPLIELILLLRVKKNKEDFSRLNERRGISLTPRPDGKLIWLHASSVGESMAALSLINRLLETEKEGKVLVTTGTLTSAKLMAERLPDRGLSPVHTDRSAQICKEIFQALEAEFNVGDGI